MRGISLLKQEYKSNIFIKFILSLPLYLFVVVSFSNLLSSSSAWGASEVSEDEKVFVEDIMPQEQVETEFGSMQQLDAPPIELDEIFSFDHGHRQMTPLLTDELLKYFELILYVNKANKGTTHQTMRIFRKDKSHPDHWDLLDTWLVSTGRELNEKYPSYTPTGIFKLDKSRMYRIAYSRIYNNAPMPHAMFLDVQYGLGPKSRKTGIAIHGTVPSHYPELGRRASGGCVRLHQKNSSRLYDLVRNEMPGQVPVWEWDPVRGRTNAEGQMKRDENGQVILVDGYKVLVVIVDEVD